MAVPFFFISSGYFLNNKNSQRQIKKIAKMYIVWSILYLPLDLYKWGKDGVAFWKWCLIYLRNFLLIGEHYNSWHLWYLLGLLWALFFVAFLRKRKVSRNIAVFSVCVLATLSIGLDGLDACTHDLPRTIEIIKTVVSYTIMNGRILQGLYYVPLGVWIASSRTNGRCGIFVTSVLFCLLLFLRYRLINDTVMAEAILIPLSVCFFQLIRSISIKETSIHIRIRAMSTIIYLIHMYVWTFYYLIRFHEKTFGMEPFLMTTVICIVSSYIITSPVISNMIKSPLKQ